MRAADESAVNVSAWNAFRSKNSRGRDGIERAATWSIRRRPRSFPRHHCFSKITRIPRVARKGRERENARATLIGDSIYLAINVGQTSLTPCGCLTKPRWLFRSSAIAPCPETGQYSEISPSFGKTKQDLLRSMTERKKKSI